VRSDGPDGLEWDDAKSERTFQERGFDFRVASRVFRGNYIEDEDRRHDYGEPRYITIGEVEGVLITAVWTQRGPKRRIIAAWPSSNQERRRYREYYPKEERGR